MGEGAAVVAVASEERSGTQGPKYHSGKKPQNGAMETGQSKLTPAGRRKLWPVIANNKGRRTRPEQAEQSHSVSGTTRIVTCP